MTSVKQSLILNAGNGVFATRNYKKGEFICYYDCREDVIKSYNEFVYSIICNNKSYIGYSSIRNVNGVGQFINDYCLFELSDDDRNEEGFYTLSSNNISDKINNYISISQQNSNVMFKNDTSEIFKLYATRDIKTDEELYLHYGIEYWITNIQLTTDEPFTRLYCLLKNNSLTLKNNIIYLDNKIITELQLFDILSINPSGNIIKYFKLQNMKNIQKIKYLIDIIQ